MKSLILWVLIINIQTANQYLLYSKEHKYIGILSIYEDNLYLRIIGYIPDSFKIKYTNKQPTYITYIVQNDSIMGYVIINQDIIIMEILIKNKIHERHKFYRK